jgi:DNA-binding GntR family transcriptional regulator
MMDQFPLSAQQEAYAYLLDGILSGTLAAGTRLKPIEIAKHLGISRMPVREAIRQLDAEGFTVSRPNRGAVVTTLSPDDMLELFEIRAALEALAARMVVSIISAKELDALRELNGRMNIAANDVEAWIARHEEFHAFFVGVTKRSRLISITANLRKAVQPYYRIFMRRHEAPQPVEHQLVIDALASNDPDFASAALRNHVMADTGAMIEYLRDLEPHRIRDPLK